MNDSANIIHKLLPARQVWWVAPAILVALSAPALSVPAWGGEAPKAPEAAPEPDKKSVVEDNYLVVPGDRRDPFTYTKVVPKLAQENPNSAIANNNTNEPTIDQRLDPAQIAAKKAEAMSFYNQAEGALMDMNAVDAMNKCDAGLLVFKDLQMNYYKELQDVRDVLLRLRKASERVKQRQDAERDFNLMNIHLTGVVARERNSEAIVNAKIVGKGDVVPSNTEGVDVVVADIQPQQVVFIFRGYKMMLTLSEIGR